MTDWPLTPADLRRSPERRAIVDIARRHFDNPQVSARDKGLILDLRLFERMPEWALGLLSMSRRRAKRGGMVFALSPDMLLHLIMESRGRCAITGMPFNTKTWPGAARRPFTASIDRIDNAKGYTLDNCRLVLCCVNIAMNEWGTGILWEIARGLYRKDRKRVAGNADGDAAHL